MAIEGEGRLLLEQMREISRDVNDNLIEIDDRLAGLQDTIRLKDEIDKNSILDEIKAIRLIIGVMEREDTQEIEEEKILDHMLKKLISLIEKTIG